MDALAVVTRAFWHSEPHLETSGSQGTASPTNEPPGKVRCLSAPGNVRKCSKPCARHSRRPGGPEVGCFQVDAIGYQTCPMLATGQKVGKADVRLWRKTSLTKQNRVCSSPTLFS